jgi:hypothetical protein
MKKKTSIFGRPVKDYDNILSLKWHPRKPCDITNPMPQDRWPFRMNAKVFFVQNFQVYAGRVAWYNPAREIDASCCVSPGHQFLNVQNGGSSSLPSVEHVFPGTKAGFKDARLKAASLLKARMLQEKQHHLHMIESMEAQIEAILSMKSPL